MKHLVVAVVAIAASLSAGASAFGTGPSTVTREGPYGPIGFLDSGVCRNSWAGLTATSTYHVYPDVQSTDINANVVLEGTLASIAGHSPTACKDGHDNGNLVTADIPGHVRLVLPLIITGGAFDPTATCDISCATNYNYIGIRNFAHTFFGPNATFKFGGPIREVARAHSHSLCARSFTLLQNLATGVYSQVEGDIATTCSQ